MTAPKIDTFKFGQVVVNGTLHTKDVIILPEQVIGNWWRKQGHVLHPEDLEAVIMAAPQVLVVGQGAYGRMQITKDTRKVLETAGIELIYEDTETACEIYNQLRIPKRVAAALHLTC
jgi:hypothetical protein